MRPVAIAGIGCLCAAGLTLRQCMDSLYAGKRQPAAPTRFPFKHKLSFPVFEIEQDFFPEDRISNGVEDEQTGFDRHAGSA